MHNEIDVTIVFVNFNTRQLTIDAINSVIDKTNKVRYEIIVVDNHSDDGSVEALTKIFGNQITLIKLDSNLGFGRANNVGIQRARGKFIFLLNTDTLLKNNAIDILYDFMNKNDDVAVCGGNLYDCDDKPVHSFAYKLPGFKMVAFDPILMPINNRRKKPKIYFFNYTGNNIEVAYITGADMMIRKDVLDITGAFDPDFFMYFEETELQNRIQKTGLKIISVPAAEITHMVGKSFKVKENSLNVNRTRIWTESLFLYFEKVYGKRTVKYVYMINQFYNILFSLFKKDYQEIIKITKREYLTWKKGKNLHS